MSDVNIIISVKNLASKEINQTKKDLDSLGKKVSQTADSTTRDEQRAARETEKAEKTRQKALQESAKRMQALREASKFLYSGSIITGGLLGSAGVLSGFTFAKLAAESDTVRISFLNTFGEKAGSILDNVRKSTKGIIDDTTAMREAIRINLTGIRDSNMLPEIFKLGAVASQRLGISAEEGLERARKAVVEFNEGAMEQLGIVNKLDPAYRTQMAIIEKSTKGLGQYLSIQTKLNYVLDQARKRYGDNFDVLETNLQGFQLATSAVINFRNNIGYLLGDALAPLARGIGYAVNGIIQFIQQLRSDRVFKDSIMTFIKFASGVTLSVAALASFKLALLGITAVFAGPFGIIGGLLSLALAIKAAKLGTGDLVEGFRKISNMSIGVIQLVSSFFDLRDGTAQINKELADTIGPKGMQGVLVIAQKIVSVIEFFQGVIEGVQTALSPVVELMKRIGLMSSTNFDTWRNIGKIVGEIAGGLILFATPASIFLSISTKILGTYQAIRTVMMGIKALQIGGAAASAAEVGAVGAAGAASSAAAIPPVAALAAASLTGIAAGYATVKAADYASGGKYSHFVGMPGEMLYDYMHPSESKPTGSTLSSLESTTIPKDSAQPPQVVVQVPSDANASRMLSKAAQHLESIDSKVGRSKTFEDKMMFGTSR